VELRRSSQRISDSMAVRLNAGFILLADVVLAMQAYSPRSRIKLLIMSDCCLVSVGRGHEVQKIYARRNGLAFLLGD
jgi:hypothetical protein